MRHLATLAVVLGLLAAAPAEATVYWTSIDALNGRAVFRALSDGTHSGVLVPGGERAPAYQPCGVATDRDHVYWGDGNPFGGGVGRSRLDGSDANAGFIKSSGAPCGIAIDGEHVYWADRTAGEAQSRIGRADLDGTHANASFITGLTGPCSVAVDNAHIYWAGCGALFGSAATTIGRADLDGSHVDENFIGGATEPSGVAVDAAHVYWSNGNGTIGRAAIGGTTVEQAFIPASADAWRRGGLGLDAGHLYWGADDPNGSGSRIGRANLDGSAVVESFVANLSGPIQGGIAVDATRPSAVNVAAPASTYGELAPITATVSSVDPSLPTPTGMVQFQAGAVDIGAPVPLDAQGKAVLHPTVPFRRRTVVSGRYSGDAQLLYGHGDLALDIARAVTVTELTSSKNPTTVGEEVLILATARNTSTSAVPDSGIIQFTIGAVTAAVFDVDEEGRVAIGISGLPAGDVTIRAEFVPVGFTLDFAPSASPLLVQHVLPAPVKTTTTPVVTQVVPQPATSAADLNAMVAGLTRGLRSGGLRGATKAEQRLAAPAAGALSQTVSLVQGKVKRVLLASGSTTFPAAGTRALKLRLTARGRRLARRAGRLRLEITTTFRPRSGAAVTVVRQLVVRARR
jgi:hypothetical protein